jgi:hypothetical protein
MVLAQKSADQMPVIKKYVAQMSVGKMVLGEKLLTLAVAH